MANKTVARNRATSEAQAKPKAYLPRWASRPALENLSRAWTKTALHRWQVSFLVSHRQTPVWAEELNLRHESDGQSEEEEGDGRDEGGNGSAQTAAAGEEAGKEGQGLEEEGDDEEDPAEAPHVVVVEGRGVAAVGTVERRRDVGGASIPSLAKRRCGARAAAVVVVPTAEVEVGPLGLGAGASDARRVGPEEVGLVEGRNVGDAGQNDEPQEEERAGKEDDAKKAEASVLHCHAERDVFGREAICE
jgi:hypothetical protein